MASLTEVPSQTSKLSKQHLPLAAQVIKKKLVREAKREAYQRFTCRFPELEPSQIIGSYSVVR